MLNLQIELGYESACKGVCVHCLLEEPELGRGLDVALEHRGARREGDEWVAAPELWDA